MNNTEYINNIENIEDLLPKSEPERQRAYMELLKKYFADKAEKLGRPLTMCTVTFGCQMNARDSEKLSGILKEIGFVATDSENADFVIYNTCTVRENANNKVYGHLGVLSNYKKKNPHMMIALCGCMMQEPQVVEKLKESYRFIDIIFGTHNLYRLAELIYNRIDTGRMVVEVLKDSNEIVEELPVDRKYPFKSGVNIMFGCNNFCSYCIVPYVRGREKSREPKDIICEIEKLVADGVKEVMLLGQNVNSYGKNLDNPVSFAELLKMVEEIDGLERIRFMTSHPKDLSDELIDVMAHSTKICRHFHLPLQSGSDRLLKIMNRHYTKERYLSLVDKLKTAMPDISLTTDIIVGFPGETEEDFQETLDVVEKSGFDTAFTFIYSKRTGTKAADMPDPTPRKEKTDRMTRLLKVQDEIAMALVKAQVGQTVKVLVEGFGRGEGTLSGRLDNNLTVEFTADPALLGQYANVHLTGARATVLLGELEAE